MFYWDRYVLGVISYVVDKSGHEEDDDGALQQDDFGTIPFTIAHMDDDFPIGRLI